MAHDHLAPLTDEVLRLAVRGLSLCGGARVADLCCGLGSASRLLAAEFDAVCTGVDLGEDLLRAAREAALAEGLQDRVEFVHGDARHVELPTHAFDLVLAMGGALTYMGRPEGLERIRFLLKPGGALLLSDLVYLDASAPEDVRRALDEQAPGNPDRPVPLEPAVRAVFEEGIYHFETERSFRDLLALQGYETLFAFPVPESAWSDYYSRAARGLIQAQPGFSIPVRGDELAAFYSWGGRFGIAYLVCGARVRVSSGEDE